MSFFGYLKSPDGRKNMLRIGLIYVVVIAFVWVFLWWYTDHGEQVSVPDLKGMSTEEAVAALTERDLTYAIVDSIYDENQKGGTILEQSPAPDSKVKEGRSVFLTIYRYSPPMERINIKEGDFAQVAIIKLKNKGIRYEVKNVPNNNMVGSVISLTHKGKKLRDGDEIARGEKVVLTVGISDQASITVPNLVGMSYVQAMILLDSLNLMGQGIFEPEAITIQDSANFRVCRQEPPFDPEAAPIESGRIIDFWLGPEPCNPVEDTP